MEEQLIIVNEKDEAIGVGQKLKIHQDGLLHRAFSIFIFNSHGELLLQRRALSKYHSPGLWSNTCCGHPNPGEEIHVAAKRRLKLEMGLDCELEAFGSLIYRAQVGHGLIEHEFDHLLIGHSESDPTLNLEEAIEWSWISLATLENNLRNRQNHFTSWLRIIFNSRFVELDQRAVDKAT